MPLRDGTATLGSNPNVACLLAANLGLKFAYDDALGLLVDLGRDGSDDFPALLVHGQGVLDLEGHPDPRAHVL